MVLFKLIFGKTNMDTVCSGEGEEKLYTYGFSFFSFFFKTMDMWCKDGWDDAQCCDELHCVLIDGLDWGLCTL